MDNLPDNFSASRYDRTMGGDRFYPTEPRDRNTDELRAVALMNEARVMVSALEAHLAVIVVALGKNSAAVDEIKGVIMNVEASDFHFCEAEREIDDSIQAEAWEADDLAEGLL
jgi:hypothetical protein